MPGNEAQKRQSWAIRDAGLPIAMSSITTSTIDTPTRRSVERTCDDLALVVLAAIGLIASLTFRDYGLGWDDYTHAEYADLLLRMYGSGFKDTGALSFANLYMYGGGFDMAAALLHKVIPLELFETRRLLGAVVGLIGLAVTWRLGRRVGGPLAGLTALLLLALCPTYLRAHVHESEGRTIRGCDGHPDARAGPAGRGISGALAAHHPDRRPRRRSVARLARTGRTGPALCRRRFRAAVPGGGPHARHARSRQTICACRLRAAAQSGSRLPHHGADLAMVGDRSRQSVPGPHLFLALLREAVEGNVRRRTGVGAGHALVVSADPVRAATPRSAARAVRCRRRRHAGSRCRAATCRAAARPFC